MVRGPAAAQHVSMAAPLVTTSTPALVIPFVPASPTLRFKYTRGTLAFSDSFMLPTPDSYYHALNVSPSSTADHIRSLCRHYSANNCLAKLPDNTRALYLEMCEVLIYHRNAYNAYLALLPHIKSVVMKSFYYQSSTLDPSSETAQLLRHLVCMLVELRRIVENTCKTRKRAVTEFSDTLKQTLDSVSCLESTWRSRLRVNTTAATTA